MKLNNVHKDVDIVTQYLIRWKQFLKTTNITELRKIFPPHI